MNEEKTEEIKRCLRLGCVRADWLQEREELEQKLRESTNMAERNYWICMKRVRMEAETEKETKRDREEPS